MKQLIKCLKYNQPVIQIMELPKKLKNNIHESGNNSDLCPN